MLLVELLTILSGKDSTTEKADVYARWEKLVRLMGITDDAEGTTSRQKKDRIWSNMLFMLWFLFGSLRMGFSSMITSHFGITDCDYCMGQTLSRSGNTSKLIEAAAGLSVLQAACYRLACVHLIHKGDMIFMRTVRGITQQPVSGGAKRGIGHRVLVVAVAAIRLVSLSCIFMFSGMLLFNIRSSQSITEMICWAFWYTQDLMVVITAVVDTFILPSIWIITVLSYKKELESLLNRVEQMIASKHRSHNRMQLVEMIGSYNSLVQRSVTVNQLSSHVLFVMISCTTPIVTVCLFTALYSDNLFFNIAMPLAGGTVALAAYTLLAVAANITSKSDIIHHALCTMAVRTRLTARQRHLLLRVIEENGCEKQPLALYTLDGQKYTSESFLLYVIECALQYLLLLTFDGYFKLH